MKFAYADPPYPGQAHKYRNHPDYAGEVDHAELIARIELNYPDGWALSTSAKAMRAVLDLCPAAVEVAIWHITNAEPPGNRRNRWWWCWEAVIIRGGRPGPVKNLLACGNATGFAGGTITGQKPPRFASWILDLLGYQDGDTIDDLYPGSGACGRYFAARDAEPPLPLQLELSPL